jgi:hypothetical protein
MARKNIQRGTEEFELFQDFWNLYKENAIVESDDTYFRKVQQDIDEFCQKHKTPFAKELAIAVANEIDRKWKNEYKVCSSVTRK